MLDGVPRYASGDGWMDVGGEEKKPNKKREMGLDPGLEPDRGSGKDVREGRYGVGRYQVDIMTSCVVGGCGKEGSRWRYRIWTVGMVEGACV